MPDEPAVPQEGAPQPITVNSDVLIALVQVFMQATDAVDEHALQAVINVLLEQERRARLDPRVAPGAEQYLRANRKGLELFRALKVGLRAIRTSPLVEAPTLITGRPS